MLYLILVAIMIFISVSLSGLFAPPIPKGYISNTSTSGYTCCDTGDKENCRARMDVEGISYKGSGYHLLKSNMYIISLDSFHLVPANLRLGPKNERVFINPTESSSHDRVPECKSGDGNDRLYGPLPPGSTSGQTYGCYNIPNDLLIYLCRSDSKTEECEKSNFNNGQKPEAAFDVYIRDNEQIPNVIKDCAKPPVSEGSEKQIAFRPSPGGQSNLQLRTFQFVEQIPPATWFSPYCKPAIYLYPEQKTEINVSVFPKGKMLLTIPPYPKLGWDVVAVPNGDIYYQNKLFDYLYYEASLPDQIVQKPKDGYIIDYSEREIFLRDLVTKLGLNEKETKQFVEYWTKVLPKSPYYFIGIIPVSNLHEISPLLITPIPDNLIRVTLYFQALDKRMMVTPPIISPVTRSGFTAVEWGGIVKQDKNHPFSCFM